MDWHRLFKGGTPEESNNKDNVDDNRVVEPARKDDDKSDDWKNLEIDRGRGGGVKVKVVSLWQAMVMSLQVHGNMGVQSRCCDGNV